ncbi:MAG: helicase-related protein [Alphaproteobacteria bacterium]
MRRRTSWASTTPGVALAAAFVPRGAADRDARHRRRRRAARWRPRSAATCWRWRSRACGAGARPPPRRAVGDRAGRGRHRRWLAPGRRRGLGGARARRAGARDRDPRPEARLPWSGHGRCTRCPTSTARSARTRRRSSSSTRGRRPSWCSRASGASTATTSRSRCITAAWRSRSACASRRQWSPASCAIVCTSSLDLGIDWGDVDLVIQMGAPKGASRLVQRIGRANHRYDTPSKALLVPGNRFEFLECQAAVEAVHAKELDGDPLRAGGLDVLAQHIVATACGAPVDRGAMFAEGSAGLLRGAASAARPSTACSTSSPPAATRSAPTNAIAARADR